MCLKNWFCFLLWVGFGGSWIWRFTRLAVGGRLCMCLPLRPTPSLRGYESKAHGLRRLLGAATRTVAATPCPCLKKNCFFLFLFFFGLDMPSLRYKEKWAKGCTKGRPMRMIPLVLPYLATQAGSLRSLLGRFLQVSWTGHFFWWKGFSSCLYCAGFACGAMLA